MFALISVPLGERFLLQHFALRRLYAFIARVSPGGIYTVQKREEKLL